VPESYGKRQRNTARAKKVAARRLERKQRDADRAAGLIEAGTPIAPNEPDDLPEFPPSVTEAESEDQPDPEENESK